MASFACLHVQLQCEGISQSRDTNLQLQVFHFQNRHYTDTKTLNINEKKKSSEIPYPFYSNVFDQPKDMNYARYPNGCFPSFED